MSATPRQQRGFALVGALFLLVVLAALGAFAVRINMTQQHGADLELQQLRAEAALNSGVEYAATRLLAPGATCASLAPLAVGGYTVTFNVVPCAGTPYTINSVPMTVFTVTVTSSRGVYGTPEFVARTSTVRVSSL